jgi:pimeloyl-ACP methyl ester carboxylesterase
MILTNPGGPGASGLNLITASGPLIQSVTGTNYDIVSWDPRGIVEAIPAALCGPIAAEKSRFRHRSVPGVPEIDLPELADSYYGELYASAKQVGSQCQTYIGGRDDAGPHMTTADVARDMISIVEAYAATDDGRSCNSASLLNFWGFSYGTMLGQTFASMFPDRVGRVVVDGVLDPEDYISGLTLKYTIFMDDVWDTFYVYCHAAGPELCPIYTGNSSLDIYNRFEDSFLKLNATYAIGQGWANASAITSALTIIKDAFNIAVYNPKTYFPMASQFQLGLEATLRNFSSASVGAWENEVLAALDAVTSNNSIVIDPSNALSQPLTAVWCSDQGGASYNLTLQQLAPWLAEMQAESMIGGQNWAAYRTACTGWPIRGDHIYSGKCTQLIYGILILDRAFRRKAKEWTPFC